MRSNLAIHTVLGPDYMSRAATAGQDLGAFVSRKRVSPVSRDLGIARLGSREANWSEISPPMGELLKETQVLVVSLNSVNFGVLVLLRVFRTKTKIYLPSSRLGLHTKKYSKCPTSMPSVSYGRTHPPPLLLPLPPGTATTCVIALAEQLPRE